MILVKIKNFLKQYFLLDGYCKKCGRKMIPVFYVDDILWNKIIDDDKEYCINCFDKKARDKNINILYKGI